MELELNKLINKWTDHHKHRPDFLLWKKGRIHQELYQQDKINLINSYAKISSNKILLDVGSGMGGLITALKRKHRQVFGVEFNFDYCLISKYRGQRYAFNNQVINAVGENLPFRSNLFDIVTCFDVLEHVNDPEAVLNEIYRVLKPNGICLVTIINRFGYYDQHFHLPIVNWLPRVLGRVIVKLFSPKQRNGFEDNQNLEEMHYFTYTGFIDFAKSLRFQPMDINKAKLNQPNKIKSATLKKFVETINYFHLTNILYWPFCRYYHNTFVFSLKK